MVHTHESHVHHGSEMKHQIADEWQAYWRMQASIPAWDYTSEIVLEALRRAVGSVDGRRVLEAGCGTGRISLALARTGAQVTAVDVSQEAVDHTRTIFSNARLPVEARLASLFELPFADNSFDIVWNAGVLEHFSESERREALRELLRVTAPGGWVVTLNPSYYSVVYRLGKWLSERAGKWPYGHEDPVRSLGQPSQGLPCLARPEFSTGFFVILIESLRVSRALLPVVQALRAAMVRLHRSPLGGVARLTDRLFSRMFGGYLLVSAFHKTEAG